jgi:hypothetical protein
MYQENERKRKLKSEEFVFTFLSQNKGKGKLDNLLLSENGFNNGIKSFSKDIGNIIENNLVNVIKQKSKYIKLELTLSGKAFCDSIKKQDIIIPSLFFRIKEFIIKTLKKIWNFIYVVLDKYLLKFFKSSWGFLILAILAFLYFYLPFKNSNDQKQNNKPNVQPIEQGLQNKKSYKKNLELLVSLKDSVISKNDSIPLKKN